jgi:hypothetical protein
MAEATNPPSAGETPITPIEAVRRAVDELGPIAPRSRLQAYVKEKFGITLTGSQIATAKEEVLRHPTGKTAAPAAGRKEPARKATRAPAKPAARGEGATRGEAGRRASKKKAALAAPRKARSTSRPAARQGKAVLLEDILQLRKLLDRVGPAALRSLLDTMEK